MKFDWIREKRFGKKDSDSAYQLAQLESVMGIAIQENNVDILVLILSCGKMMFMNIIIRRKRENDNEEKMLEIERY